MFTKYVLRQHSLPTPSFNHLFLAHDFEQFSSNRLGAILTSSSNDDVVPIVRTTTVYTKPSQRFVPIHDKLIEAIKHTTSDNFANLEFNNAMVEVYDSKYTDMKYHSD